LIEDHSYYQKAKTYLKARTICKPIWVVLLCTCDALVSVNVSVSVSSPERKDRRITNHQICGITGSKRKNVHQYTNTKQLNKIRTSESNRVPRRYLNTTDAAKLRKNP